MTAMILHDIYDRMWTINHGPQRFLYVVTNKKVVTKSLSFLSWVTHLYTQSKRDVSLIFYVNLRMTPTLKREQADHEYLLNFAYKEL